MKLTNNKGSIQKAINIDSIQQVEKEFKSSYKNEKEIKEVEVIKFHITMVVNLLRSFNCYQHRAFETNIPLINKIFGK